MRTPPASAAGTSPTRTQVSGHRLGRPVPASLALPREKVPAGVEGVSLVFGSLSPSGSHRVQVLDSEDEDQVTDEPEVVDNRITVATEPLDAGVHKVEHSMTSGDGHTSSSAYYFEGTPNPNHGSGVDTTTLVASGAAAASKCLVEER